LERISGVRTMATTLTRALGRIETQWLAIVDSDSARREAVLASSMDWEFQILLAEEAAQPSDLSDARVMESSVQADLLACNRWPVELRWELRNKVGIKALSRSTTDPEALVQALRSWAVSESRYSLALSLGNAQTRAEWQASDPSAGIMLLGCGKYFEP
jgi:hypothetical protein